MRLNSKRIRYMITCIISRVKLDKIFEYKLSNMKNIKNVLRVLLVCMALVVLTACSTMDVKDAPVKTVDWVEQQQLLSQLERWTIKGRISVQSEYQGGQVDYIWHQHNKTDYNIRLQAPMGAGTTLINARENGVNLTTSSGGAMFDTDIDKLMLRLNGWPLPVSGLQYWIKGLPAPNSNYEVSQWSDKGYPHVMLQDGWRIEFKKYKVIAGKALPGKLFINRTHGDEVDVRLVIRQWVLN